MWKTKEEEKEKEEGRGGAGEKERERKWNIVFLDIVWSRYQTKCHIYITSLNSHNIPASGSYYHFHFIAEDMKVWEGWVTWLVRGRTGMCISLTPMHIPSPSWAHGFAASSQCRSLTVQFDMGNATRKCFTYTYGILYPFSWQLIILKSV